MNHDEAIQDYASPVCWPFIAIITQDGEPLAEWKCSTAESLLASIRPYLEMPDVTVVITTANQAGDTAMPHTIHKTADGYPVNAGEAYWDSGLHLVNVLNVASYSETNSNPDSDLYGVTTWWHDTTGGMADGSRLAKRHPFTGQLAGPDYKP